MTSQRELYLASSMQLVHMQYSMAEIESEPVAMCGALGS